MLIRTASDALALGGGQEHRTAEGGGTDEDFRGFFCHEQGTQHRLGGGTTAMMPWF